MMVSEELKSNIIKAVETAPSKEKLAKYLRLVSESLDAQKFDTKTVNLQQAIDELCDEKEPAFQVPLQSACFKSLTDFFWLSPGLHVIAAPSGHGKTMWATEWAIDAAKQGHTVLMWSLEMTAKDIAARVVSKFTDFALRDVLFKKIETSQFSAIKSFFRQPQFEPWVKNFHIETTGDYDWSKIFPKMWDQVIRLKPKVVILDYIQMLHNSEDDDGRQSRVLASISRDFKLFAEETKSAAIILSQMNRQAYKEINSIKNGDDFFTLSSEFIKESGGIVEAADTVQLVCMTSRIKSCPPNLREMFQVTIDKSRRIGELGTVMLPFDSQKMKFIEQDDSKTSPLKVV